MVTEAFIISYEDKKAYLDIDRTYKYGGIMLLSDDLKDNVLGIYGESCYEDFSLKKWFDSLDIKDAAITLVVHKGCDGNINDSIKKEIIDDVLNITVKEKRIIEVKNTKNETIYSPDDDIISDYSVGWFGKIFDYYTNIVTKNIAEYNNNQASYIWGVSY